MPDQPDLSLRVYTNNTTTNTPNSNLTTINQQLSNIGAINQQLNSLSQQLNGLNQQSQNLQNFQHMSNLHQNQKPNLGNLPISNMAIPNSNKDIMQQNDLLQLNQDLLNRLQNLNIGFNNNNNNSINNNCSPNNAYMFTNSNASSNNINNNNHPMNLLSSPSSVGNLTPSPIGTLNRSSYSASPLDDSLGLSMDKNMDGCSLDDSQQYNMKSTPQQFNHQNHQQQQHQQQSKDSRNTTPTLKRNEKKVTLPNFVTLRVTDETGHITNAKKLPATPSFIQRSTSEKVPNRSQIMSQVQRTTWARHTTK